MNPSAVAAVGVGFQNCLSLFNQDSWALPGARGHVHLVGKQQAAATFLAKGA